jgi:hypothetical protein
LHLPHLSFCTLAGLSKDGNYEVNG